MMIPSECKDKTTDSRVKVEELGRKAVFINEKRETFIRTKFDGCVVKNCLAADWLISKMKIGDIIVELKGKNVEHGMKQIMTTANFLSENGLREGKIAAIIVCRQYPKVSTSVQLRQAAFHKEFGGLVHVSTINKEWVFENLFSKSEDQTHPTKGKATVTARRRRGKK